MTWRETLEALQVELADVRAERLRQAQEENAERNSQRQELIRLAESMEIAQLVQDMNLVLLQGSGEIESHSSWEMPEEEPEDDLDILRLADDDDAEEADYVSTVLTWEEDGERELAVDLGLSDDGIYLQINGIDIRPEREALEQALIEAFREELEV